MINKFHKTTYPRTHNFNVVSSSQSKRNTLYQQPTADWTNHAKPQMPIERKIDIESSLLFNHKNHSKAVNKNVQTTSRKPNNRSEAKFYETSTGFSQARQRPQSKQEPRSKVFNETKLKTQTLQHQRPQTSKGDRKYKANISAIRRDRQTSEQQEQIPIQVKITGKKPRAVQSSYSKRSTLNDNSVQFNTSIDPEFLSLFAN